MFDTAARFRAVAIAEAFSWLGLLVGMFFKYATDFGDLGVKVFGPIHGAVFVIYLAVTAFTAREQRWDLWTTAWAFVSSIPPLATIVFERWVLRTGKLDPVAARQTI
ncbi:DUF3817 domain-containing protein [Actinokineospora sp. HUAS TT18]|uniref:DUF3817 domain-containing protein n=1 Tax=Actinokineospora sp. HUAS TT18 TaxID=3447451 RepID=UPI003F521DCA